MNSALKDFRQLLTFLVIYWPRKVQFLATSFEKFKNLAVNGLMLRRGRFQKEVWHFSMIGLASAAVLTSGVVGGNINTDDPRSIQSFDPFAQGISLQSLVSLKTDISQKPRSEVVNYTVKSGDTLSTVADKYAVSSDTIRFENDLTGDTIKPGDTLRILPVSGVSVTVKSGDTLESLAKKYSASSQGILDFPFNDVPDDLHLTVGQALIIPDGVPPEAAATPKPKPNIVPNYLAQGSSNSPVFSAPNRGNFIWPTTFAYISTYFAWWHLGIDLPNNSSPPIHAADGGTVVFAGWDPTGYGNRVDINHGNGYVTRYGHLSNIYVTTGQELGRGQVLGQMGSTGRSTGTHLHFEIHFNGVAVNPLAILK